MERPPPAGSSRRFFRSTIGSRDTPPAKVPEPPEAPANMAKREKGKRKKQGVLTGLAKGAPPKKRKGAPSRFRSIVNWVVGIAVGGVVLGIVVLYAILSFNPSLQERPGEAEVRVEAIEQDPAGYPDEIVAAARVTIDGRPLLIPLTSDRLGEVEVGAHLQVRYVYFPQTQATRIDSWTPVR